jgi:large conductance mechanosensitive channel
MEGNMKKIEKPNLNEIKGKSKGFINEFKAFVLRGNVMDMAIGVIIGTAFAGLVTAFTEDFVNPLINGIGGAEIGGELKIYGGQVIKYGDFITSIINFLIMAFILFLMLKAVNKLMDMGKKKKAEDAPEAPVVSEEILLLREINESLKKQNKNK